MATLRTYIFAFLLICFSAGNVFAQSVELQVDNIRREMKAIDSDESLKIVLLNDGKKSLKDLAEGEILLTGRFKSDEIKKLEGWIKHSDGVEIQQFYFNNGQLIFAHKIYESDSSVPRIKSAPRYFIHNQQIIDFNSSGRVDVKRQSVQELTKDAGKLLKLLMKKLHPPERTEIVRTDIIQDEIFKIVLSKIDTTDKIETPFNSIFSFQKLRKSTFVEIFKDSVYSKVDKVELVDFNNDNVKDILIQNISDARSNWTYYLYVVDTLNQSVRKIQGFEEIKNPKFLPEYNLIESYVLSGKNWVTFYKIENNSVKEFDVVVEDELDNSDKFERDYENAIQKILAIENEN